MKKILIISVIIIFFAGCKKDDIFLRGEYGEINGYKYVDLGLPSGLKWATCNVGAISPYDVGNYYAWGETETKKEYNYGNCSTDGVEMSDISGDSQYDVARKEWGATWRMPNVTELEELIDKCNWKYDADGLLIIGPNGLSIYIPNSGYIYGIDKKKSRDAYLWSSTPDSDDYDALGLSDKIIFGRSRFKGMPIRPVSE